MANVGLLESTLDEIRMNRDEHDQALWGMKTECGTTMCFAGHAVTLAGAELVWAGHSHEVFNTSLLHNPVRRFVSDFADQCIFPGEAESENVYSAATRLLDLTEMEAIRLFLSAKTFDDVERTVKDIINAEQAA